MSTNVLHRERYNDLLYCNAVACVNKLFIIRKSLLMKDFCEKKIPNVYWLLLEVKCGFRYVAMTPKGAAGYEIGPPYLFRGCPVSSPRSTQTNLGSSLEAVLQFIAGSAKNLGWRVKGAVYQGTWLLEDSFLKNLIPAVLAVGPLETASKIYCWRGDRQANLWVY